MVSIPDNTSDERLSRIEVEARGSKAFEKTWIARSRGMWGIAALGLLFGAAVGVIAPFFPMAAGAAVPALATIGKSVAIFAAVGMAAGFVNGTSIGIASGAASSMAEDSERRVRMREVAAGPGKALPQQVVKKDDRNIFQKFSDDGFGPYFNLKVGAVVTAAGMIGGAVMGAAYIALGGLEGGAAASGWAMPGMGTLLGAEAAKDAAQVMAYFIGVTGSFGALWNFNFPRMAAHFQDEAGKIMSGERLGAEWTKGYEPAVEMTRETPVLPQQQPRRFENFQSLLALQEAARIGRSGLSKE